MRENASFSLGSVALIDKVNVSFGFFDSLFSKISGKAKNLKEFAKLFAHNKLGGCVSVSRILEVYPDELFEYLGFEKKPKERPLYRALKAASFLKAPLTAAQKICFAFTKTRTKRRSSSED